MKQLLTAFSRDDDPAGPVQCCEPGERFAGVHAGGMGVSEEDAVGENQGGFAQRHPLAAACQPSFYRVARIVVDVDSDREDPRRTGIPRHRHERRLRSASRRFPGSSFACRAGAADRRAMWPPRLRSRGRGRHRLVAGRERPQQAAARRAQQRDDVKGERTVQIELRELPAVSAPAAVPATVRTWSGESFQNRPLVSVLEIPDVTAGHARRPRLAPFAVGLAVPRHQLECERIVPHRRGGIDNEHKLIRCRLRRFGRRLTFGAHAGQQLLPCRCRARKRRGRLLALRRLRAGRNQTPVLIVVILTISPAPIIVRNLCLDTEASCIDAGRRERNRLGLGREDDGENVLADVGVADEVGTVARSAQERVAGFDPDGVPARAAHLRLDDSVFHRERADGARPEIRSPSRTRDG